MFQRLIVGNKCYKELGFESKKVKYLAFLA